MSGTLRTKVITDDIERMEFNLTNHHPAPEQIEAIEDVRFWMKGAGRAILECCPPSRERSLALTALEETTMWAVAAIARAEVVDG